MSAKLFCKTGQLAGAEFLIEKEATIGKWADNDIVLYPNVISGKHARIYFDKEKNCYFLEDLHSRNGTNIDSIPVKNKEKLDKLNIITFANDFDFIFQEVSISYKEEVKKEKLDSRVQRSELMSEEQKTMVEQEVGFAAPDLDAEKEQQTDKTIYEQEIMPVPEIPGEGEQVEELSPKTDVQKTMMDENLIPVPYLPEEEHTAQKEAQQLNLLYLLEFKGINITFTLKEGENVIGRSMDCDIPIDDPSISRRHAIILVKSEGIFIKDLGSKNHTFVNDNKIESEVNIQPDSSIRFGEIEAMLTAKIH